MLVFSQFAWSKHAVRLPLASFCRGRCPFPFLVSIYPSNTSLLSTLLQFFLQREKEPNTKQFIFTISSHTKSIIHGTRYHIIIINSISFKNQDPYIHRLIQSHVSKSISHYLKIFPVMAGGDKGRPSKKHKSSSAKVLQITLLMLFERDFGFFLIGLKLGFFCAGGP